MNYTYTCKKVTPNVKEVSEAGIYFRNGDFFRVAKSEILDLKVEYYDKLVSAERGFIPYARGGLLKLKLSEKKKKDYDFLLCDAESLKRGRKEHLERRCLEDAPYYFAFFDENNWHRSFFADTVVSLEGDELIFTFVENVTMGSYESAHHTVNIRALKKNSLRKIHLDFENCDGINVYEDEIQEVCLNFKKELYYASEYLREVSGGYIRIKFNKEFVAPHYYENVYDYEKKPSIKKLEERIVGKGESEIDICHLYVTYLRGGSSFYLEECICTPTLEEADADEKITADSPKKLPDISENDEYYNEEYEPYVSGYAKRDKDGSILIVFGKPLEYEE